LTIINKNNIIWKPAAVAQEEVFLGFLAEKIWPNFAQKKWAFLGIQKTGGVFFLEYLLMREYCFLRSVLISNNRCGGMT